MMMLPTWRLELEVERLMIAELAPSASYRKHACKDTRIHTENTYTYLLRG